MLLGKPLVVSVLSLGKAVLAAMEVKKMVCSSELLLSLPSSQFHLLANVISTSLSCWFSGYSNGSVRSISGGSCDGTEGKKMVCPREILLSLSSSHFISSQI